MSKKKGGGAQKVEADGLGKAKAKVKNGHGKTGGSALSGTISKASIIVALAATGVGVWYKSSTLADGGESSTSLESRDAQEASSEFLVDFKMAGILESEAIGTNVTLTEEAFQRYTKTSSLYSGLDGRRLRSWTDVQKVAAAFSKQGDPRLVLFQGPLQDIASMDHFIWPIGERGHRIQVAEVPRYAADAPQIELEFLNADPRVYYVHNFMSQEEADALVARAVSPNNPYNIRPSTVGHQSWTQGSGQSSKIHTRTSENAFDIDSPTAKKLKARAWKLLRISGNYDESLVDGFQILRYQQKQAYIAHMDPFPLRSSEDHNWDPTKGGTNRFATLFVYLSDVEEGGQTVFPGVPGDENAEVPADASKLFQPGSWEMTLTEQCYRKLSVKPKKGNAILFYSQTPGGVINEMAKHGGCPVLNGTKWGANLWFWNQCRYTLCTKRHLKAGVKMRPELLTS